MSDLLNLIREEGSKYNPPQPSIGEVVSANPLIVKYGNLEWDKDNLLLAGELPKIGDSVVMLPTNNEYTFIVMKVVEVS